MGEKPNNRRAFENLAGRIVLHQKMQGKAPDEAAARRQAADVARTRDRQKDDGSARNAGRRTREPVAVERRPPSVFVDMGRRKR